MSSKAQHQQLSKEEIEGFREAFSLFDKNGDGTISAVELGAIMRELGQNPTEAELHDIVAEADIDQSGTIDFNEFLHLMARPLPTQISQTEELKRAFEVFDKDGSGTINKEELKQVMKSIGENLTDAEVNEMMDQADLDRSGSIDWKEFLKLMDR